MAKPARKKNPSRRTATQPVAMRAVPNWPLFGLALVGMGLTAYLTIETWRGSKLAFCTGSSGCDLVLTSQWSTLFGLPTSFWGFLAYASLAGIAWIKEADTHWKLAWFVSLVGVLYSLYLTSVSIFKLGATCPYCLTSATLMVIIFATVACQRPADLPKFSWIPWIIKTALAGAVVVLALHLHYAGFFSSSAAENPEIRALAEHLTKTGAKFYGAYWCPHCQHQKELFGASVDRLPYVECTPLGPNATRAAICDNLGINSYPTWIINGNRYEGVLELRDLAQFSDYKGALP